MSDERTVAKETIRDWAVRIAGVEDEMYDAEGFDPGDDEQTEKLTHARGNLFDAACDLLDALGGHSGDFEGLRGEARRRKAGDGTGGG